MNKLVMVALLAGLVLPTQVLGSEKEEEYKLKSFSEKLSYSLGLDIGASLREIDEELNFELIEEGLEDAFYQRSPRLSQEEMQKIQQELAMKMQAKQQAMLAEMANKNKKAGDEYLASNKKKKGVTVTKSGLQYEVLKEGTGAAPAKDDVVTVHYKGTTIDGVVFDESYGRQKPVEFGVDQVIPGWTEALLLMKEGATFRLAIPPALAYGEQGVPPMIEPNAVLLFDVELLSVAKKGKK